MRGAGMRDSPSENVILSVAHGRDKEKHAALDQGAQPRQSHHSRLFFKTRLNSILTRPCPLGVLRVVRGWATRPILPAAKFHLITSVIYLGHQGCSTLPITST